MYVAGAPALHAQSAGDRVLTGAVLLESTRQAVPGVEVAIPSLNVSTESDVNGVFRLTGIPRGRHEVVARRMGYKQVSMKLSFADDTLRQLFLLRPVAELAAVNVTARTSWIPGFDDRRKFGMGHALTSLELDKVRQRNLGDILIGIPGLRVRRGRTTHAWATASRGATGEFMPDAADRARGAGKACYSHVYMDGMLVFGGAGRPLFDLNRVPVADIEAVEYFTGGASTPPEFRMTGSVCGVLAIWTRRK